MVECFVIVTWPPDLSPLSFGEQLHYTLMLVVQFLGPTIIHDCSILKHQWMWGGYGLLHIGRGLTGRRGGARLVGEAHETEWGNSPIGEDALYS